MKSGQCVLCLKSESEYLANKVVSKKLTHEQAAKEMGVSLPEWVSHYELHVRNKLINAIAHDIVPIKKNLLDKISEATKSVERIIKLTENLSKKLEDEDNQKNIRLIQAYAQLERNAMANIKDLALLEGDISSATTVHIQNNTIQIDKLMSIVMEDAPEEFKKILLEKMKTLGPLNAN